MARYSWVGWVDIAIKIALVTLLLLGAFSGLQQFEGKAFGWRLATYPLAAFVVPAAWLAWFRMSPYPAAGDALLTAPLLIDVAGNALDLYDTVSWWDDANPFVNWALLTGGAGLPAGRGYLNIAEGDGFGDLLITVPGETRVIGATRRTGVVYLIFGGAHLDGKQEFFLREVGKPFEDDNGNGLLDPGEDTNNNGILERGLPGIVFVSPFQQGTLDEAAPLTASFVGDLNGDGFADVIIGNPLADFIDPQSPGQRRTDAGEAYLIYGSNAGDNTIR